MPVNRGIYTISVLGWVAHPLRLPATRGSSSDCAGMSDRDDQLVRFHSVLELSGYKFTQ